MGALHDYLLAVLRGEEKDLEVTLPASGLVVLPPASVRGVAIAALAEALGAEARVSEVLRALHFPSSYEYRWRPRASENLNDRDGARRIVFDPPHLWVEDGLLRYDPAALTQAARLWWGLAWKDRDARLRARREARKRILGLEVP